ncbi:hypothetical protein, partial [Streptomyces sp. MZ04]|uniref:hypothetical protein n=1 Tax=Streptomyces sp. MZ04 TaxID=2559236 RepID=UPI001ADEDB73
QAVGTGVLTLSVIAKLADWQATVSVWPVGGRARLLAGPGVVTAGEAAVVAAALAPLPVGARLAVVGMVFAGYAVAAVVLRGRECGCFGGWLPSRFTLRHALACLLGAVACLAGAVAGPVPVTAASTAAVAGVAVAVAVAGRLHHAARRRRRRRRGAGPVGWPTAGSIDHVVIFTAASCGFCAALEAQQERYEAMAGCPLEFRNAATDEDKQAAGNAYPAAVAYDAAGSPVTAPAHGLADIRDLLRHTNPPPATT